ncbi:MAG: YggS family pyridoxal phosphate-dependent enzyme [Bermanella sp.]
MPELDTSDNLAQQFITVKSQIELACTLAKKSPLDVQLLAVSKKHPADKIQQLYQMGQTQFGENYVQEGVDKVQALTELDIEWHFIGPIQSNKSRLVSEHFHWVHTISNEKIARRLNDQRPCQMPALNVLIQVNISEQDSKSGITLDQVESLAKSISNMGNLTLRGLMCIPAPLDESALKNEFRLMHQAFLELNKHYPQVDTLSMGMSADLNTAIECGSTMVRIGSAIFGARTK